MEEDKPPLKSLPKPRKIVKTQKTFNITEIHSFFSNFMSSRIPTPSIAQYFGQQLLIKNFTFSDETAGKVQVRLMFNIKLNYFTTGLQMCR